MRKTFMAVMTVCFMCLVTLLFFNSGTAYAKSATAAQNLDGTCGEHNLLLSGTLGTGGYVYLCDYTNDPAQPGLHFEAVVYIPYPYVARDISGKVSSSMIDPTTNQYISSSGTAPGGSIGRIVIAQLPSLPAEGLHYQACASFGVGSPEITYSGCTDWSPPVE